MQRLETIQRAKTALIESRAAYKRIEYFLEYFFATSSRIYNKAPKNEIEEPFMGYQAPAGFQYLEVMLFEENPEKYKTDFSEQIRLLTLSARNLNALLYQFPGTDAEILESLRIQLIRIITLGITGFDAPSLKSGISESQIALESMQKVLDPYLKQKSPGRDSVRFHLGKASRFLSRNHDFDSFDRMAFLTETLLPLQKHLGGLIREMGLTSNKYNVLNYDAENLFSAEMINIQAFPGNDRFVLKEEIALGKVLFSEPRLSGNSEKSCASCHNPANFFGDGLPRSIGLNGNIVRRNAPSLLYSGFQHNQFWDGRAKSLEDQIKLVLADPIEMKCDIDVALRKLNDNKNYRRMFRKAFSKKRRDQINEEEVYRSIASYVRTLGGFNSAFDRYMNGDRKALNSRQVAGFNLFMGKAQCGTCHFAPLFNGLIPPTFTLTEFEILGIPRNANLAMAEPDTDEGRFDFRPSPFYRSAFKTPTVRNTAKTGPYMHNGAFSELETVIEFYDLGGGAGIGLSVPNQTLSSAKLNLTDVEKKDIIEFLDALTDNDETYKK